MKRKRIGTFTSLSLLVLLSLSACEGLKPGIRYDGLNAYAVAEKVAKAASVYGSSFTADSLMAKTLSYSDALSSKTKEDAVKANFNDVVLLLHQAFGDILPQRIGARTFQGYPLAFEDVIGASELDAKSQESLRWLCSTGLLTSNAIFSGDLILDDKAIALMLDRFHAYFGESYADDFFTSANHDYLYDDCEIPSADPLDESRIYDSRLIPQDHINNWARSLLPSSDSAKNFNDSFMDAESRAKGKLAGLRVLIDRLLSASTIDSFVEIMQQEAIETGYCPLWNSIEFADKTYYVGNNAYYRKSATVSCFNSDKPSSIYVDGYGNADDPDDSYARSVARFTPVFQEGLSISESAAESYAKDYTHFKYLFCKAREGLVSKEGNGILGGDSEIYLGSLPLSDFLSACGVNEPEWFFWESSIHAKSLLSLFEKEENLPYLKGFALWQLFAHYSSCLPAGEAIKNWAFSGRYSTDEEGLKNEKLWGAYCLPHISGIVANRFRESEDYADQIAVFVNLLDDLKEAMGERIQGESWLSEEGKSTILKKLATLSYSIGGTNSDGTYLSYEEPTYLPNVGLYQNLAIEENFEFDAQASHIGEDWTDGDPAKASQFDFFDYCQKENPLTANAFYMASANAIDIYLGYIAAYDDARTTPKERFLATFGRTLGHELSHAFDDSGLRFDENGSWAPQRIPDRDYADFSDRVAFVAESYDGYEVIPGQKTIGTNVVGEAIADITGATLCLDMAKKIPGFDYRSFFLESAKDMATYVSQRTYVGLLASDSHPVGRGRINTCFRLLDEFHETFQTKEGDGMYLDPEVRFRVW
ncbi:MAG: hypothetical protein J5736_02195 [Bacilli bacterium]|nr:hypothetical protein [Bacilli bacterium]